MDNSTQYAEITKEFFYNLDKTNRKILKCEEFEDCSKTYHLINGVIILEVNSYAAATVQYYIQDINY